MWSLLGEMHTLHCSGIRTKEENNNNARINRKNDCISRGYILIPYQSCAPLWRWRRRQQWKRSHCIHIGEKWKPEIVRDRQDEKSISRSSSSNQATARRRKPYILIPRCSGGGFSSWRPPAAVILFAALLLSSDWWISRFRCIVVRTRRHPLARRPRQLWSRKPILKGRPRTVVVDQQLYRLCFCYRWMEYGTAV